MQPHVVAAREETEEVQARWSAKRQIEGRVGGGCGEENIHV